MALDRAFRAILTGEIAARRPSSVACRRQGGRTFVGVSYDIPGAGRAELMLDPTTALPVRATLGIGSANVSLAGLRYLETSRGAVLGAFRYPGMTLRFTDAAFVSPQLLVTDPPPQLPALPGKSEIPLEMTADGHAYVAKVRIGERAFRFLLDSGVAGIVVSDDVAHRVGLRNRAAPLTLERIGGPVAAYPAVLPTLAAGSLTLSNVPAVVVQRAATLGYDGLLGTTLLSRGVVTFAGDEIVIDGTGSPLTPAHPAAQREDIDTYDGVPEVGGLVDGRPAQFVLDTGAATGFVLSPAYGDLGGRAEPSPGCEGHAATGSFFVPLTYRFASIAIAGATFAPATGCVAFDVLGRDDLGLLGFDRLFGWLTVLDERTGHATFRRPER